MVGGVPAAVLSALLSLVNHLGAPVFVMIPVGSPLALVFGLIVYQRVERPMTKYLNRRRAPAAIPAPAVGLIGSAHGE
jgi:peptidoglycan/LPS O-acetylase OafA/YrhL